MATLGQVLGLTDSTIQLHPSHKVLSLITILHRHRGNVRVLLHAQADPWQAVPICALCDHPWYWFGLLSRRECVNAVQVSAAQDPVDTVADLLTQSGDLWFT